MSKQELSNIVSRMAVLDPYSTEFYDLLYTLNKKIDFKGVKELGMCHHGQCRFWVTHEVVNSSAAYCDLHKFNDPKFKAGRRDAMMKDPSTGLIIHRYSPIVFEPIEGTGNYEAVGYKYPGTNEVIRRLRDIDVAICNEFDMPINKDVPIVNDGSDAYYANDIYIPNIQFNQNTQGKKNQESQKKKVVLQYDHQHKLMQTFSSASHAAKALGISQGTVSLRCNGKSKQDVKYILSYVVLEEVIDSNQ